MRIKNIILLVCLVAVCCVLTAFFSFPGGGGEVASGGGGGETYEHFYNADHSSGTTYAYTNAGGGSANGTLAQNASVVAGSSDPGTASPDGGNCLKLDGTDDHIRWSITDKDYWDSSQGFIEGYVYITDDESDSEVSLACCYSASNMLFKLIVNPDRTVRIIHYSSANSGDGANVYHDTTNTISTDEWVYYACTHDTAGSANGQSGKYLGVKIGSTWEYFETQIYAFDTEPDYLVHGEYVGTGGDDTYYLDGVGTWTSDDQS